ncbi:exopolysaccharide biosynthesis protein [Falsiroseomonas ponticola]|uniref:exopolysaccharide biosynthesis protein n=1 Tax=Falsiroseomonas ponticola TaxID=2786951 RepID=UPI001933515A|nr:exopolysaccharide biosynthesis protein [Roseomonas ponticola]
MPVSALLDSLARDWPTETLTLGDLAAALGQRGFGVLIVIFALPNLLPFYLPGLSTVAGLPMMLVAAQLAAGRPRPALPGFVARRRLSRDALRQVTARAMPWMLRVERMVRPRPSALTSRNGERLVGLWVLLLGLVVILPTPLTNGPPALACLIMAMGVMENDTVTITAGAVLGLLAAALSLTLLVTLGWALLAGVNHLIGSP